MKVLNVNMTLDPIMGGGTAERTFQLSRTMAKTGLTCTLLTTDQGLTTQRLSNLECIRVIALPTLLKRFYIPKFSYRFLLNIIRESDIIHLMPHWTLLNAMVYFITSRLKKPYVLCPAGTLSVSTKSNLLKYCYNLIVGKKIILNASSIIATTGNEIPHIMNYGVSVEKIAVIPNAVNDSEFVLTGNNNFREKYGIHNNPFLLFIGRIEYLKGPDLLLHAFMRIKEKYRNYHLVFSGPDDGMLPKLKKIASNYITNGRVHFLGYVGGRDKVMAYHAADLVVIPSRHEAMSIVVIEAGATGTPVLITDCCGFNQITDCNGGLVVPASIEGLTIGLETLLRNRGNLAALGENLKHYTLTYFRWEDIIKKYIELFTKLIH